jgi:hypothetical protein
MGQTIYEYAMRECIILNISQNPATLTVEAGHFALFSVFIAKCAICFIYVKFRYHDFYAVSMSMYDCRGGRFHKLFVNYYHY